MFNAAQFRKSFPEFADLARYTDDQIIFWAQYASLILDPCKFGKMYVNALSLYVAHEITLSAQSVSAAQNGGVPGSQGGIANTKTVGSASIGYDATSTSEKDAGWYNLTNYGKQLWRLIGLFGQGAVQL